MSQRVLSDFYHRFFYLLRPVVLQLFSKRRYQVTGRAVVFGDGDFGIIVVTLKTRRNHDAVDTVMTERHDGDTRSEIDGVCGQIFILFPLKRIIFFFFPRYSCRLRTPHTHTG